MRSTDRKAAIAACKERKQNAGIFALVCVPIGETWLGGSPNVDQIQNRVRFQLDLGRHRNAALRATWKALGADNFRFERKEVIEPDLSPYAQAAMLEQRLEHWRGEFDARLL